MLDCVRVRIDSCIMTFRGRTDCRTVFSVLAAVASALRQKQGPIDRPDKLPPGGDFPATGRATPWRGSAGCGRSGRAAEPGAEIVLLRGFLRTQTKTPRGGRGKKAKMLTLHYPLSYR